MTSDFGSADAPGLGPTEGAVTHYFRALSSGCLNTKPATGHQMPSVRDCAARYQKDAHERLTITAAAIDLDTSR